MPQPSDRAGDVIHRGQHAERHHRKQPQHRDEAIGGRALPHHHGSEREKRRDGEELEPDPRHLGYQRLQRRHPRLFLGVMAELLHEFTLAAEHLHVLRTAETLLNVLDDHFRVVPLGD